MQRVVRNEEERHLLVTFIKNHKLPFTASILDGAKRSVEQNKLQRKWIGEISDQTGEDKENVRARLKLEIGVPILRDEHIEFREAYDTHVKHLPYESKLAVMKEPISFPVTSIMTTKQKARFCDEVFRKHTEMGIELTIPPDPRMENAA